MTSKPMFTEKEFKEALFNCVAYMTMVQKSTHVEMDMGKVVATLDLQVKE